jgi:hypothetical protein
MGKKTEMTPMELTPKEVAVIEALRSNGGKKSKTGKKSIKSMYDEMSSEQFMQELRNVIGDGGVTDILMANYSWEELVTVALEHIIDDEDAVRQILIEYLPTDVQDEWLLDGDLRKDATEMLLEFSSESTTNRVQA